MKKLIFSCLLSVLFLSAATAQYGPERTGYEGDYFSLEGAIELFKHSNSIEDFERRLNTEDTWVNNLDLNYDGEIDYIRVEHIREGNFHAIILQAPINRYEVQDVAVIEIEKVGRRRAILQIVGDEDLYGEEVIVEPVEYSGYSNGRGGPNPNYEFSMGYVNVFFWTPVQFIFGRHYRLYVSPFRWHYYPIWWSPWRQCGWRTYHPRVVHYHTHYHVVHVHRVVHVHHFYKPHRAYSHHVVQHTNHVRVKHGKAPVHRPAVKQSSRRSNYQNVSSTVAKKQSVSSDRTKVNQKSTSSSSLSSKDKVKQTSRNTVKPQQGDSGEKIKRQSYSSTKRSTPKVSKKSSSKTRTSKTKSGTSRGSSTKSSLGSSSKTRSSSIKRSTSKGSTSKSKSIKSKKTTKSSKANRPSKTRTTSKSRKSSVSSKKAAPSSSKKVKRNASTKKSSSKSKRGQ